MKRQQKLIAALIFISATLLISCKVENMDNAVSIPKSDFSYNNYVLATEDASNVDITTFFSFQLANINNNHTYDLISENTVFTNANPSTSSGFHTFNQYIFSLAKDKNGYSSTPGLFRLTQDTKDRLYIDKELHISKNNLFPSRLLCIVNEHLGYFYDEGNGAQELRIFDPTTMVVKGKIDLKPHIASLRPNAKWVDDANNNLIRIGTQVLESKQGKLYASIVFLEAASFNLIAESESNLYIAVIDIQTQEVEKIIQTDKAITVGFFVSENKATSVSEDGSMYLCSWGWNQFNKHRPSKVFRINTGETEIDSTWEIDIEQLFGVEHIAQSMIVFNNKIYLHVSDGTYTFTEDAPDITSLSYYEFDPKYPNSPKKLAIPASNTSSRMNVFSIIDDKLFIAVPNFIKGNFNGFYSIDKQGNVQKEMSIENKFRPTRLYKLHN